MTQGTWAETMQWRARLSPAWRRNGGLLLLLLLVLLAAYWPTIRIMGGTWWMSSTYAHCWLVLPIVIYMIWQARAQLASLTPVASPLGLLPLCILALVWLVAQAAEVMLVQQFALVAMMVVMSYCLLGAQVIRVIAFPLGYLFFAIPFGDGLVGTLQDFTAWFTVKGLRLSGLPVLLEGRHISIPSGDFLVAEACSGIRYLIVSLALGCLYAYLSYRSPWRRLAFIILSGVLPILANGLRAYGIVMLAYLTNHRLAVGVDHLIYGWLFFGLVVFLMFWMGSYWREDPPEKVTVPSIPDAPGVAGSRALTVALLIGVILALGPLAVSRMASVSMPAPIVFEAPPAPAGWRGPLTTDGAWEPVYVQANGRFMAAYQDAGDATVDLFGVLYLDQQQGRELIHFDNSLYDKDHWAYDGQAQRTVALPGNRLLTVTELLLRSPDQRRWVLWHWYRIGETPTVSPVMAKLLEAWERLRGGEQGSRQFALASIYEYQPEEARERLQALLNGLSETSFMVHGAGVE